MKEAGAAIAAGLRAPVARWRLVLTLWLVRLLPVFAVIGLPVYAILSPRLSNRPDASLLLDPSADAGGFSFAALSDLARDDFSGLPETLFWLVVVTWLLVTVVAGGIVARFVHGRGSSGLFVAECGRYAGRFLRLGLLALVFAYIVDAGVNALLAEAHGRNALLQHTQRYAWHRTWVRGFLYLTLLQIVGAVHAYARIDIVANERRSAFLALLRGLGTLIVRLPKLLVIETAMLLAAGAAAFVAWVLLKAANPLQPDSGWVIVVVFAFLAALGSYLRTGIEVGTLEARCRLLAPEPATVSVSHSETPRPQADDDTDDLVLPEQSPA